MHIISGPRGSGRTEELIKYAYEHGYYIACLNMREADTVVAHASRIGLTIRWPITYAEVLTHRVGGICIVIDNIERFLDYSIRAPIVAFSCEEPAITLHPK